MPRKSRTQKFDKEALEAFCTEKKIELYEEEHEKITKMTKLKGKCITVGCHNDFAKSFRCLVESGPYCNTCARRAGVEKCIETCIKKFGVEHASQAEEIKEKSRQTNLVNRGVAYPTQDEEVKQKIVQVNRERRGVDNVFQDPAVREKYKKTMRQNHGVSHPSKSPSIVLKRTETAAINRILRKNSDEDSD